MECEDSPVKVVVDVTNLSSYFNKVHIDYAKNYDFNHEIRGDIHHIRFWPFNRSNERASEAEMRRHKRAPSPKSAYHPYPVHLRGMNKSKSVEQLCVDANSRGDINRSKSHEQS